MIQLIQLEQNSISKHEHSKIISRRHVFYFAPFEEGGTSV